MTRKYFPNQLLDPADELAPQQLESRSAYVTAVYRNDELVRLEIVLEGKIAQVIYRGDRPDPGEIVVEHRLQYPGVGMVVKKPGVSEGGYEIEEEAQFSPEGLLLQTARYFRKNDDIAFVEYRDEDGKLIRKDVHEQVNEELSKVVVFDGDGHLLYEEIY